MTNTKPPITDRHPPAPSAATPPPAPQARVFTPVEKTLLRGFDGDETVLPELRKALDDEPYLWEHYGNIAGLVERSIIQRIACKDLVILESIILTADQLRKELAGETRLEKLMIDRIVSASLQVQCAELALSSATGEGLAVLKYRLKELESAEHRFQAATKNLALVRRLLGGVQLRVQHEHTVAMNEKGSPTIATATGPVEKIKSSGDAGLDKSRMEGLFGPTAGALLNKEETLTCQTR